jgi:K+-sensing histidine kinase KdpD
VIKTAVLRAVSHDLRTPLMAISTSASALARPDLAIDDADRAELLATILSASDRLDRACPRYLLTEPGAGYRLVNPVPQA